LRISIAETRRAADRSQTLFEGAEPAIFAAAHIAAAIKRAPRIILRLGAAAKHSRAQDCTHDNAQSEKR
jgi:hypothetical protein